ncbi:hypothetical protein ABZ611_04065 [Streptomyces sp. NPDC007861]|uniref:hypothetical protein n=1 Tax=Streptomyces sp. NPDC007861 TaxID=3154893 RepID=UPI0033DE67B1
MTQAPAFDPTAAARSVVPFPRQEAGAVEPHAPKQERQPPQAEVLRVLGQNRFRYLHHNGAPYAVPYDGPPVGVPLRATAHTGTGSLRQHLIRAYVTEHNRTPSQSALADAVAALDALAMNAPEAELPLRIAADPDDPAVTWLDLGRADGESVRLASGGWALTHPCPDTGPVWRRTKLVRPLPRPDRSPGGWRAGVEEFAALLPFTAETLPLAVGWLLAALRPSIPRPVAYLTGEQGTGKSTSGQMLAGVIEGARAPLRQAPETLRDLGPTTAAGWVLALDNLSGMPGWLSDALCRIVTGDAQVTRALYTDDDVNVLTYQRPVLLTGIDLGAVRNDLAERMMPLELQPIPRHKRRTAGALWAAYERAHPRILGALLDLAAEVWADLPYAAAELTERPRLADFAELLHALDRVTGWHSLDAFAGAQDALNDAVLDGHPVAAALREWTASYAFPPGGWQGTMAELHRQLGSDGRGIADGWPKTPAVLSARIRQVAPALRARGIHVARTSSSNKNGKVWAVTYAPPS